MFLVYDYSLFILIPQEILPKIKDVLAPWRDVLKGSEVTDNEIFSDLPRHWEEEFHKDMEALNVSD